MLGLEEEYNNIESDKNVNEKEYLLHKRLKTLRINNNFSQKQVGEFLQIAGPTVSRWETKVYIPNADDIAGLAKLFDVSADYLLGLED